MNNYLSAATTKIQNVVLVAIYIALLLLTLASITPTTLTAANALSMKSSISSSLASSSTTNETGNGNGNDRDLWPYNGKRLKGIVSPLVTPLLDNGNEIDVDGTKKLIEHVINGGVCGIFLLGTTGEGPTLSSQLKREFVTTCCEIIKDSKRRVPVLVLITESSLAETIAFGQFIKQLKGGDGGVASALSITGVLTTPYYYPLDQSELLRYVDLVIDGINNNRIDNADKGEDGGGGESSSSSSSSLLPIMLYNIPGLTKTRWDIETIKQIAIKYSNNNNKGVGNIQDCNQIIVGIKDSSGDLQYFDKLCQLRSTMQESCSSSSIMSHWTIMIGPEHLTKDAIIDCDGDGGVNGGSNVEPNLFVQLYETATKVKERRSRTTTNNSNGDDDDDNNNNEEEEDKDKERTQILQTRLNSLMERVIAFQDIYKVGRRKFGYIGATKCALVIRNIISTDCMVEPMIPFTSNEESEQVESILKNLPKI